MSKEIEKKFIVWGLPEDLNLFDYECSDIIQGYLIASDDKELRIRKIDDKYYMTYKQGKGNIREEWEVELTKKEGLNAIDRLFSDKYIKKTRYYIPYKGKTIELDIMYNVPFHLAEIEFDSVEEMNNFEFPDWFDKETDIKNKYIYKKLRSEGFEKEKKLRKLESL
ncbi:MAG: CYTH domain-containing protein [Promethearchaeota archaeon]